ncbi:hypothetical protein, partial [Lentzea indica]|uniref:hypothetical protein n=1 Tax=Lentzea indica TaxID=2604800 RepID=UPI0035E464D0
MASANPATIPEASAARTSLVAVTTPDVPSDTTTSAPPTPSIAAALSPAHDPNDFEIGQRHNLPNLTIMDGRAV